MNKLEISEIQILPVKPQNGLVAFCSFVINNQFYVGDVALYTRPDGWSYRLVYPVRKLANGKTVSCVHPIYKQIGEKIEQAVTSKYTELIPRIP